MKRLISALLLCSLLLTFPVSAAGPEELLWYRFEPGGQYVTIRVPVPEELGSGWAQTRYMGVRYADSKETLPLAIAYKNGWIYVTLPAREEGAPSEAYPGVLEAYIGEPTKFEDCYISWKDGNGETVRAYGAPAGAEDLNLKGVILGDEKGSLNPGQVITRAEAFTIILRLIAGTDRNRWPAPDGSFAFDDVKASDWYFDTAQAAKELGLTNQTDCFYPTRPVTRGEFTVMLYRAMKQIGWLVDPEGDAAAFDLTLTDRDQIPGWAYDAYHALAPYNVGIFSRVENGIMLEDGPEYDTLAEHTTGATREEVIYFVYDALRSLPCYPSEAAIEYGFDREMPVIDGSTSTYPYTRAVYGALFTNYDNHPDYPAKHSKSYYAYERLISGEADLLFIAAKPTQDTIDRAAAAGVTLEFIPIAYDAMVFFTNGENSITGLTSEQVKKIYVDNTVTNWKALGGPDATLIPYCRNADSGSQALMEEFFLEGGDIHPDIRKETTSISMASVLTDVWQAGSDDPAAYALGYSIYYYYQQAGMILLPGPDTLKLLSIDGVSPTEKTIADGSYPLAGYNYIAIRSDQPKDSPARRMVDFMLSEAGQQCVVSAGYGALHPPMDEYLAGLKAEELSIVNWPLNWKEETKQTVVELLNRASHHIVKPPTEFNPLLWLAELSAGWSYDHVIRLEAGLEKDLVRITTGDKLPGAPTWVKSPELYQLLRTSMDTPDGPIDQAAYAKYRTEVELYAQTPEQPPNGITFQHQVNAFYLLAENKALNAQAYALDLLRVVTPAEKAYVLLAGGQYLDSQLRIHGDNAQCLIVVDGQPRGFYSREWVEANLNTFTSQAELLKAL